MQSRLIGVDRRGGKGYQEVFCENCGNPMFIDNDSESGICARCVVMGYPKSKTEINIVEVRKALEKNSLKQYRKGNKISQGEMAGILDITERHYRRLENGRPIGKNISRKIERKLAQAEQNH